MAKALFKSPSDVKVGVVGYGGAFNMGRSHLQQMQAAGMTPVSVCDLDKSRLTEAEKDFPGIETYTSIATMLKKSDVNLIVLITPHNLHAKQALQCLKAGRHVVVEKPMAVTTKECDQMIAEAKKRGLIISTYHNRHWDGWILEAMKQIKKQGKIGEVVRIEAHHGKRGPLRDWWRSSKTISGGILYDWGVHILEYALQIVDSKLVEVSGFTKSGYWAKDCKWGKDSIEDDGTIVARFASGAMVSLNITQLDALPNRDWVQVIGTEGTYVMNQAEWRLVKKKGDKLTEVSGPNPPRQGEKFYQNIADHLAKGEELIITGEWARRPIHIIDLAFQSAAKGKAMKAKYE